MGGEEAPCVGMEGLLSGEVWAPCRGEEAEQEDREVGGAASEGRDVEDELLDAEPEVLSEGLLAYELREVLVGGEEEADVGVAVSAAERGVGALSDGAQEEGLEREGEVADLVEEESASVCGCERARVVGRRAGEGMGGVSEELGVGEVGGEGGGVELDEGLVGAAAGVVDGAREEVLSAAGLACEEDGAIGARDDPGSIEGSGERGVLGLEIVEADLPLDVALRIRAGGHDGVHWGLLLIVALTGRTPQMGMALATPLGSTCICFSPRSPSHLRRFVHHCTLARSAGNFSSGPLALLEFPAVRRLPTEEPCSGSSRNRRLELHADGSSRGAPVGRMWN